MFTSFPIKAYMSCLLTPDYQGNQMGEEIVFWNFLFVSCTSWVRRGGSSCLYVKGCMQPCETEEVWKCFCLCPCVNLVSASNLTCLYCRIWSRTSWSTQIIWEINCRVDRSCEQMSSQCGLDLQRYMVEECEQASFSTLQWGLIDSSGDFPVW